MNAQRLGTKAAAGLTVLLLAGLLAAGCGDDDTTKPPEEFAPPTALTYVNDDGVVYLSWTATPDAARSDFAGYAVYRHTASMIGMADEDLPAYRLNDEPVTLTQYDDTGADNGVKYYYAVRAVKSNGNLSQPTNEIDTAPRPLTGPATIFEFAAPVLPSGIQLATGTPYRMLSSNPDNRPFIDVYLGTTDANDLPEPGNDQPYALVLKSPHLVLNSDPDWAGRVARLKLLESWDDATTASDTGWSDQVNLGTGAVEIVGKVVAIHTPGTAGQRHYAKVQVLSFSGNTGQRQISLRIAYQTIPEYIRFSLEP